MLLSITFNINIVFGWFKDSYTGKEQELPHVMMAGYQKGAQQARRNLAFTINERIGRSASELTD